MRTAAAKARDRDEARRRAEEEKRRRAERERAARELATGEWRGRLHPEAARFGASRLEF